MSLNWNDKAGQWEWEGSVRDLVNAVGNGDARLGFVLDKKSKAKLSMNISGTDDPLATEPFFVESPDGDNLYDAGNRRETVKLLTNIRKGMKDPDLDYLFRSLPKRKAKAKKSTPRASVTGLRGGPHD